MPVSFWLIAAVVFALDRLSKCWVLAALAPSGAVIQAWPGVFRLVYAENIGVAFSLFAGMPWVSYLLTPIILMAGWLLVRPYRLGLWPLLCLGAILGGAAGNYLDRLIYGFVIDMIDVAFMKFAVFNLADAAICLGGALLAVSLIARSQDWRPKDA